MFVRYVIMHDVLWCKWLPVKIEFMRITTSRCTASYSRCMDYYLICFFFHFCTTLALVTRVSGLSSLSLRCSVFLFTSPCVALCAAVSRILIFRANTALRVVTGCVTSTLPIPSGKGPLRSRQKKKKNHLNTDEWKDRHGDEACLESVINAMREGESRLGKKKFASCPLPSHLGSVWRTEKRQKKKHPHEKN